MTGSSSFWFANVDSGFYPEEISTSLRMEGSASSYLIYTPSGDGNKKTFTFSVWVKRTTFDSSNQMTLLNCDKHPYAPAHQLYFNTDDTLRYYWGDGGAGESGGVYVDRKFRDVSGWYHIVLNFDTTQSTKTDRIRIYVNGERQTLTGFYNGSHGDHYPTQNYESSNVNMNENAVPIIFGAMGNGGSYLRFFSGYMAELNYLDGAYLDASNFGETKEGVWIPKEITGLSYGTNGCRLQFANIATGTASSSTIGADTSGQNNHRSTSGLTSPESAILDTPTNNWSTFNNLVRDTGRVLTYGGLRAALTGQIVLPSTFEIPSTGKWYFEMYLEDSNGNHAIGVYRTDNGDDNFTTADTGNASTYFANGEYKNFSGQTSGFSTYGNGDKIAVAVDMDNLKIYFAKNNTWQNSANPSSGSNGLSLVSGQRYVFYYYHSSGSSSSTGIANFGQDSSFAGRVTQQNNADANNRGDFFYAPPSNGYLSLCSANLPETTISPNSDEQANDYFDIVTWTGNGSSQNITSANFASDLVWTKTTSGGSNAVDHKIIDSVRGDTKTLESSSTDQETTDSGSVSSITSTGFSVGNYVGVNGSSRGYIAWLWKGGTTSGIDTTGQDITPSGYTFSQDAGFSIVAYTGNKTDQQGVPHGLGAKPDWVVIKDRDNGSTQWVIAFPQISGNDYLYYDSQAKSADSGNVFFFTPTTTTVEISDHDEVNKNSTQYIMYCFRSIDGYSRIGSYKGNELDDGTYVFCGFRPRFLWVKNIDATESGGAAWIVYDTTRSPTNVMDDRLFFNATNDNYINANYNIDFLSNGFKIRDGSANYGFNNANTYAFYAVADQPFKYANGR